MARPRPTPGTRALVGALLERGLRPSEVASELGISRRMVRYHAKALGRAPVTPRAIDWDAVQRYHDEGHSGRACQREFGLSSQTWHAARVAGRLRTRPAAMPLEELTRTARSRQNLRRRLVREGVLLPRCGECGLGE
jgi:hypothetical protein